MDYLDESDHDGVDQNIYPDIDENMQYPWQGVRTTTTEADSSLHSVIDPRLYKDLFPAGETQFPDQSEAGEDIDDSYYGAQFSDEDSEYEYSGAEGQSDEEFSEVSEEDADDDGRRRRRRRQRSGPFSGRYGARGGKGIKRGPRKPLEPSPEFKLLHSEATSAFIDGDYERAIDLVKRAIQINPEMFAAHSLLSEIFLAQGEKDKALTALFSGAHTRPRDPTVWAKVARMILERAGDDRQAALNDVIYCYSRVIDIDPRNYNARYQRAAVYRELGHNGRAATEYERILNDVPHDTRALRHLAEVYIDLDKVSRAVDRWAESIEYYLSLDPEEAPNFSWSDVNIYAELYTYLGQHEKGLNVLKQLARWLLGRKDDTIWETFDKDDREWDADDSPRRIKLDGYIPGQWPRDSYGLGLPLELRIKLGLYRLRMGYEHKDEALFHFEWLNPEDTEEGARLYDYGDLFREVADALNEMGLAEDALRFYMPLQQTNEYADVSYFMALGDCFRQLDKLEDAENCYITVAEHDARHIQSRVQLARLYDNLGMSEQALKYVNEAVLLERQEIRGDRRRKDTRLEQLVLEFKTADMEVEATAVPLRPIAPKPSAAEEATTLTTAAGRRRSVELGADRTENVQYLYKKLFQLQPKVKEGSAEATEDWLDIADALLREFRSNRAFYPVQRNVTFLGYSRDAQKKGGKKGDTVMDEMEEMASRLQESLGNVPEEPLQDAIPTDYHGISFDEWLDLFLEYALIVAGQGEPGEGYEALAAAADASIWYHSKPSLRLIHVCWFTCALRAGDGKTLVSEARWFIKKYQFVTDTYRLHTILSRVSGDPVFHAPPEKKFMLRQIRAIDYNLPKESESTGHGNVPVRPSVYKERASLTTRDESGELITAEEMDITLLYLYGHMLFSTDSFMEALNYFFRAYALDDKNPAVLLSIALCYIRQSLKRQSENRHYQIIQGLSFMQEYRRVRERKGCSLQERQEMEFNFARVYHTLSLAHLAVEGYQRVLGLGEQIRAEHQRSIPISRVTKPADNDDESMPQAESGVEDTFVEDFSLEAAMALQGIYALNGDFKSAQEVTTKWLVI
ncbi:hypothetical protein BDV59DRAFT_166523 [Aspergillus ambiguus]|uniref:uncharacterized protein n=1 Tax=Aspergillus ambiguus TaxID=176160 RepID=UPI003CCCD395